MERILIIDDDTALCELVGEYLQPLGFSVEAVHRGDIGAERALRSEHDLILLDVMLPGQNGFEVLRQIRESSKIPVLMLTARDTLDDKLTAAAAAGLWQALQVPVLVCAIAVPLGPSASTVGPSDTRTSSPLGRPVIAVRTSSLVTTAPATSPVRALRRWAAVRSGSPFAKTGTKA